MNFPAWNDQDELNALMARILDRLGLVAAVVLIFTAIYFAGSAGDAFLTPDQLYGGGR